MPEGLICTSSDSGDCCGMEELLDKACTAQREEVGCGVVLKTVHRQTSKEFISLPPWISLARQSNNRQGELFRLPVLIKSMTVRSFA